jgi:hypothetical protein
MIVAAERHRYIKCFPSDLVVRERIFETATNTAMDTNGSIVGS